MLKILKVCSNKFSKDDKVGTINCYKDESLINYNFLGFDELEKYNLTKFKLIQNSGESISFELRKGIIVGIELLGCNYRELSDASSFIDVLDIITEIPINTIELDGNNSNCKVEMFTIEQDIEFKIKFSPYKDKIELIFDNVYSSSRYGNVFIYYNEKNQLSGIKLINLV